MRVLALMSIVATVVGLLVSPAAGAETQTVNTTLPDTFIMFQQIELLEQLNAIHFTSAQAATVAAAIQEPYTQLEKVREKETSAELYAALKQVRDQMITGTVGEGIWLAVMKARGVTEEDEAMFDEDPVEQKKAQLSDEIARAFMDVLTDDQIAVLTASDPERIARDFFEELNEMRAEPPEEWAEFKDEFVAELSGSFEEGPADADAFGNKVTTFLDKVRNMSTDQYYGQRSTLQEELLGVVRSARQVGPDEKTVRALNRLSEIAEVNGLLPLLQEMATADRHFAAE